jgi:methionine-rich copper-binding protein CopC
MRTCSVGNNRFVGTLVFLAAFTGLFASFFTVGCGRETLNVLDTTPPYVVSTTPAQDATGVAFNAPITATFSEPVQAATVTAASFTVASPTGAVTGAVTLSGNIATFTPAVALAPNTFYTGTITTAVKDIAGNAIVQNYVWNFLTVPVPAVISTIPANGAVNVPVNQMISATFLQDPDHASAALNCATFTASTFTVTSAAGPVAGTVTCAVNVVTFTPSGLLAQNTLYTATITTGAKNLAGIGMAANYVWTFTTGTQPAVIATNPVNGATGVPLSQIIGATFNKVINCATINAPANSFTVTGPGGVAIAGTVSCSGTGATFTPAAALTANTLYTASISTAVQDLLGQPLAAAATWTFRTAPAVTLPTVISTTPANNATGVAINTKVTATFSTAMNPATINPTTFTLTGPGGVAVVGTVTYVAAGSVATFTPGAVLLANTTYVATITTGAQDTVTPPDSLAANYQFTFTTGAAPDTTRPTVLSTIPVNGAIAVPLNQTLTATFSEAMNPATIIAANFTLTGPGATPVPGVVTYAAIGNTATFSPSAALVASTLYTATVTTGVTDLAGNALLVNYVWTFTTGVAPDTTKPTIVSTVPLNGSTGVALNQAISATFSEAMNPLTLTSSTFLLTAPGAVAVTGTVTYDPINFIATLKPTVNLLPATSYVTTVTTGATDLAGNPLGPGAVANPWTFTTGAAVVSLAPPLGTISTFGGFGGGSGMTNMGTSTVINGNIGTTGVSTVMTGFHDATPGCTYTETGSNIGFVNGAIDTAPPPPTVGCPNEGTAITAAIATQAAADALTAYGNLVATPGGQDVSVCAGCGGGSAGELGNRTLAPGVYKSAPGTYAISLGDLTLDAKGDANAVWIFQAATTLTVGTPAFHRSVVLVNGAQAKNVFWQVGTAATINGILGGGTMQGTVIAQSGIAVSTAGVAAITTVNGRLVVLTGPVTLVNTVINVPAP